MAARFKLNGTNGASLANPLSPDTGSGFRLIPGAGITYTTAQFYEGTSSITGNATDYVYVDNGSGSYIAPTSANNYFDFFFRCSSLPGSDTLIFGSFYPSAANGLFLTSDGRARFKDSSGTTQGQSSASLIAANTWVRIRVRTTTTGSNGIDAAWVWTSNLSQDDPSGYATQILATAAMAQTYVMFGDPMSSSFFYDDIVIQPTSEGNPTHTSTTTHNADASRSTTSTITATANSSRTAGAALSTTSAVTSTAGVTRFPAAALSTTATLTATATRTAGADAALSTAAAITATMTVTPPAGSVSADVALSTSSALTATAALTRPLDSALSTAAALAATAGLSRPLAAALSVTASLTASMLIEGQVPTTPGFMRPLEMSAGTMRRPTSAGSVPRIVALVDLDVATMTALLSTSVTPSALGVPIFQGGSVSPADAGLIAAGLPYVWFAGDGTVYKETGS